MRRRSLSALCVLYASLIASPSFSRLIGKNELKERQRHAVKRWKPSSDIPSLLEKRVVTPGVKNITFSDPRANGSPTIYLERAHSLNSYLPSFLC